MGKKSKVRQKSAVSIGALMPLHWKTPLQDLDLAKLEKLFACLPASPSHLGFQPLLEKEVFPVLLRQWENEVFPSQSARWACLLTHPVFLSSPTLYKDWVIPKLLTENPKLFDRLLGSTSLPSSVLLEVALNQDNPLWFSQVLTSAPHEKELLSLIGQSFRFLRTQNLNAPCCEKVLFDTIDTLPQTVLEQIDVSEAMAASLASANKERVARLIKTGIRFDVSPNFWRKMQTIYRIHSYSGYPTDLITCIAQVAPFVSEEGVATLPSHPEFFIHLCQKMPLETLKKWATLIPPSDTLPQVIRNIHESRIIKEAICMDNHHSLPKKM